MFIKIVVTKMNDRTHEVSGVQSFLINTDYIIAITRHEIELSRFFEWAEVTEDGRYVFPLKPGDQTAIGVILEASDLLLRDHHVSIERTYSELGMHPPL